MYPVARHTHFLVKDPYSNEVFLSNGDLDNESAIYYTEDFGETFSRLGGGSQLWRSLSMIFTPEDIFWNTDTQSAQYIMKISRNDLSENVNISKVKKFPLINGALWCKEYLADKDLYIMSSNNEGALYDGNFRSVVIKINNRSPQVYELFSRKASGWGSQLFPVGIDIANNCYLLDLDRNVIYKCSVDEVK